MNCLVTGGAGFIGNRLCEALINKGYNVICYDNFSTGNLNNIRRMLCLKNFKLVEGDILDKELLEKSCLNVDYIFHLAAQIHVENSLIRPCQTFKTNIDGTINVLEIVRDKKISLVYASSAEVYGTCSDGGFQREDSCLRPMSPYASSKVACEALCFSYKQCYGLDIKIIRNFNTYGEGQRFKGYGAVIPIFINRALNNKDLIIYGDGLQSRDFQYVDNAIDGYMLSFKSKETIYNTGSGKDTSILDLANIIIRLTGSESKIIHENERQGEVRKLRADISLSTELGYVNSISIEDGLEKTVRWFRDYFDPALGLMK
jgi:UDP-glucose 4-epimerase